MTPFFLVTFKGNEKLISLLIENKADINKKNMVEMKFIIIYFNVIIIYYLFLSQYNLYHIKIYRKGQHLCMSLLRITDQVYNYLSSYFISMSYQGCMTIMPKGMSYFVVMLYGFWDNFQPHTLPLNLSSKILTAGRVPKEFSSGHIIPSYL